LLNTQAVGAESSAGSDPGIDTASSPSLSMSGKEFFSPIVYGFVGSASTRSVWPCSIAFPPYSTDIRSLASAITPMSWVIKSSELSVRS
jgi:hypothetical protein